MTAATEIVVVAGTINIAEGKREQFLSGSMDAIAQARITAGCLDFAVSADTIDKNRVNILELWATQQALEEFRGSGPGEDLSELIVRAEVAEYRADRRN